MTEACCHGTSTQPNSGRVSTETPSSCSTSASADGPEYREHGGTIRHVFQGGVFIEGEHVGPLSHFSSPLRSGEQEHVVAPGKDGDPVDDAALAGGDDGRLPRSGRQRVDEVGAQPIEQVEGVLSPCDDAPTVGCVGDGCASAGCIILGSDVAEVFGNGPSGHLREGGVELLVRLL